jgi:hypothetical protein
MRIGVPREPGWRCEIETADARQRGCGWRDCEFSGCGSATVMVIVATKTKREETRIMSFMLVLELEFVCLLWEEAGTRLE